MKYRPIGEAVKEAMEELERMGEAIQIGENALVFTEHGYPISLESIKAGPRGILHWLLQLSEKQWFTTELMKQFIIVASGVAGFDPYRVVDEDDSTPTPAADRD